MSATTAKGSHVEVIECRDSDMMSDDDEGTTRGGNGDEQPPEEKIGNNELIEELAKVRMQLRRSQKVRM
jgi:hypothetical protein